ncbi:MAG: tetratricopeptide repeat protein [Terriglobia bacterium]
MEREVCNFFGPRQHGLPQPTSGLLAPPRLRTDSRTRRYRTTRGSILVLAAILAFALTPLLSARPQTVESFLSQAKQLEDKQDYDAAIKVYLQASSTFPDQPEILKRLGIMYQTQLKFAESIQAFQKVLQINSQFPETNFYLGVSYLGYNDYDKALGYFNQELKFHPDYRRAHLYAAKALLALGREGEAVEQYQILAQQNPKDARVWFEMASLYRSLAQHAYKQLETIDPDSAMLDVLRAEAYADDLKYQDAVTKYQEALKKQPDFPGLHFSLGQIYYKMDKPGDAEPELRLALKEDPDNPPANYMLGQILLRNEKAQEALPYLQVAVNGDPTFMKGHLELGKCYLQLGKVAEAQQALSKAVEADPHSPAPHVLLVQVYTRLNDDEKRKSEMELIQKLEQESRARVQGNLTKAAEENQ